MNLRKSLILCLFCIFLVGCRFSSDNYVTIINDSSCNIKKIKVEVCRQIFIAENLLPDKDISFKYSVYGPKSGYEVEVEYEDGRIMNKHFGYVPGGFFINELIIVKDAEIDNRTIILE